MDETADQADLDPVDQSIAQWSRERPDLRRLDAMALIGRLGRLAGQLGPAVEAGLEPFGLKIGEFDVLACLRRAGEPFELTPTALGQHLLLSSGAMTNRIDRLEQQGLVERRRDPDDRRGVIVGLTAQGRALIDEAVGAHLANEVRIVDTLPPDDRAELERLVRALTDGLRSLAG